MVSSPDYLVFSVLWDGFFCVLVGKQWLWRPTFVQRYSPLKDPSRCLWPVCNYFSICRERQWIQCQKNNRVIIKNSWNSNCRHVICYYTYTDCFTRVCLRDSAHFCLYSFDSRRISEENLIRRKSSLCWSNEFCLIREERLNLHFNLLYRQVRLFSL